MRWASAWARMHNRAAFRRMRGTILSRLRRCAGRPRRPLAAPFADPCGSGRDAADLERGCGRGGSPYLAIGAPDRTARFRSEQTRRTGPERVRNAPGQLRSINGPSFASPPRGLLTMRDIQNEPPRLRDARPYGRLRMRFVLGFSLLILRRRLSAVSKDVLAHLTLH